MLKIGDRVICVKSEPNAPHMTKLMTITTVTDVVPEEKMMNPHGGPGLHHGVRVAGTKYNDVRMWPRFWIKAHQYECACQFRPIDEVPKKEEKRKPQSIPTLQVVLVGIPAGQQIVPGSIRIR